MCHDVGMMAKFIPCRAVRSLVNETVLTCGCVGQKGRKGKAID